MPEPSMFSVNSNLQEAHMWSTTGVTNTSGALTFTIPAGAYTTILAVHVTAVRDTTNPALACFALVRSFSTASVVVQVFESKGTTVVLGGGVEGLEATSTATTVLLTVIGN